RNGSTGRPPSLIDAHRAGGHVVGDHRIAMSLDIGLGEYWKLRQIFQGANVGRTEVQGIPSLAIVGAVIVGVFEAVLQPLQLQFSDRFWRAELRSIELTQVL